MGIWMVGGRSRLVNLRLVRLVARRCTLMLTTRTTTTRSMVCGAPLMKDSGHSHSYHEYHELPIVPVVLAVAAAGWATARCETGGSSHPYGPFPTKITTATTTATRQWWRFGRRLPRPIRADDPVLVFPERHRRSRQRDDETLRSLSSQALAARDSGEVHKIAEVVNEASRVAYGCDADTRQNFLVKYGCVAYTPQILDFLIHLGNEGGDNDNENKRRNHRRRRRRGIVEWGAGNGQWARALTDRVNDWDRSHNNISNNGNNSNNSNHSDSDSPPPPYVYDDHDHAFVVAYDDFSSLPLDPAVYHSRTVPAHQHFFAHVRRIPSKKSKYQSLDDTGVLLDHYGSRVLLLVCPPPGPMAHRVVRAYPGDTVVYVGEGRGGANADDAFFDFFCSHDNDGDDGHVWILTDILEVDRKAKGRGKGHERCFCFRRIKRKNKE